MLIFVAIGLTVGILLGLTGAGGSVFAVPLLIGIANLPPNEAMGLSLGAVALSSAIGSYNVLMNRGALIVPTALLAGLGVVFAPIGRALNEMLPPAFLVVGFGVLSLAIAAWMWRTASSAPQHSYIVRSSVGGAENEKNGLLCPLGERGEFALKPRCMSVLALFGVIVGVLSGLFGVGGGFLIVPMLIHISGMTMRQAVAASLIVITLVSTSGFSMYLYQNGSLNVTAFYGLALGSVVGMYVSRFFIKKIAGPQLQKSFAVGLVIMAIYTIGVQIL